MSGLLAGLHMGAEQALLCVQVQPHRGELTLQDKLTDLQEQLSALKQQNAASERPAPGDECCVRVMGVPIGASSLALAAHFAQCALASLEGDVHA